MNHQLPSEIQEWLRLAERLQISELMYDNDYDNFANKLDQNDLDELAAIYHRMQSGEVAIFKRWLLSQKGKVPISREEWLLRNLFHLWFRLRLSGRPQFRGNPAMGGTLGDDFFATPDWSRIPVDLQFLGESAVMVSKFEYPNSPDVHESIREAVTLQERAELLAAAERLQSIGYNKLTRFLQGLSAARHIEAFMLENLIAVMDALQLPYY